MKRIIFLLFMFSQAAFAQCDLTQFRWDCEIKIRLTPTPAAHSLVYCGDTYGYVTKREWDIIARYQRANVNMNLNINNEYATGPCIPGQR